MNSLLEIIERAEVENLRTHHQAISINVTGNEVLSHQIGVMLWHLQEQEHYLATAKARIKHLMHNQGAK